MCTHMRTVFNQYTHQSIVVKCGKCKACQQEHAAQRARRIRAEYRSGYIVLSVLLSYDRYSVPFVYSDDIRNELPVVQVHRWCDDRHVRFNGNYDIALHRKKGDIVLADQACRYDYALDAFVGLKELNKGPGKVGVLYYKDVQDFNKRIKQNLVRHYNYDGRYTYFVCGEYGKKLRPHWHLLIFCKRQDEQIFRDSIRESWTFGDLRKERRIEVARDMAGYVASYVNRGAKFPPFLSFNFPPKTHYSQGFGHGLSCFRLNELLAKVQRGDLSYNIASRKSPTGFVSVLTPQYVLNRYFPRFKGDSRLSLPALRYVLRSCDVSGTFLFPESYKIDYTCEDLHKWSVRLRHACAYFMEHTGLDEKAFADAWINTWNCYKSNLLKNWHTSPSAPPLNERYYNLYELYMKGGVELPFDGDFDFVEVNPNNFKSVIQQTQIMIDTFDSYQKYKELSSFVMSETDEDL